ncbi:MAG TPA: peptidylprolyl isomerase [Verrucomicrobiae bacterium]
MKLRTLILSAFLCVLCGEKILAADLFADKVVARAKGLEIKESDLEKAFIGHKAASAAMGQPLPGNFDDRLKAQILDKMIATRLMLVRATPQDREDGKATAQKLIAEGKQKASNESTYRRRLLAVGSSPEEYEAEILEQATVQAVIERELGRKEIITDADTRKYYEDNADRYKEPEKARVQHILFATRRIPSGEPLSQNERTAKKTAAERTLERARAGEDFSKLVLELSDDPESKPKNGELTFSRGRGVVPPQFESAAFSLEVGKISDPVLTVFGYHIIKLLEKIPAGMVPFDKVHERIRLILQRDAVQKKLPDFLAQIKKDAGVEILLK